MNEKKHEVFISYKNTVNGEITEDAQIARELYESLESVGINAFFSGISLSTLGADRYKEKIDSVLDECCILIAVGTSSENLQSSWVKYEWDSFYSDILMENKIGRMFSYIDKFDPHTLPRTLRNLQCFEKKYSTLESIIEYVQNALEAINIEKENKKNVKIKDKIESHNLSYDDRINKLLKFANMISCGDINGTYINPYISDEMADIVAKNVGVLKEYNAETCVKEGLNPVIYEVFLAQKIARINKPESCIKSFNLLHEVVNSWNVFLNEEKKVVAYWIFIALQDSSYNEIKKGKVDEMNIGIEDIRFIDMPGRYKGYLLLSGTIGECRTPKVVNKLYSSWLNCIQEFAKNGIFFEEISSMVGSAAGNSSLTNIGMKQYADYISGGKMYKYNMKKISEILYLKKNYPIMTKLYNNEFRDDNNEF